MLGHFFPVYADKVEQLSLYECTIEREETGGAPRRTAGWLAALPSPSFPLVRASQHQGCLLQTSQQWFGGAAACAGRIIAEHAHARGGSSALEKS